MTDALNISILKNFDSVMTFLEFAGIITLAVGCYHLAYGFSWTIGDGRIFFSGLILLFYIVVLPAIILLTIVATFFHPLAWRIWLPAFLYLVPAAALIYEAPDLVAGLAWILHGSVSIAINSQRSGYPGRGSI